MPQYTYDSELTQSTAKSMYTLSVLLIFGGAYMLKLALDAQRTHTMIHLAGSGRQNFWPWEGFATAGLMFLVAIASFWVARAKAKEWRERVRQRELDAAG